MPFTIKIDKDFAGPYLVDLEPILDELEDPVEARWSSSRQDLLLYDRYSHRVLVLVVPDVEASERTSMALGGAITLPAEEVAAAQKALSSRADQTWRKRIEGLGRDRGALLLAKAVGDSLRNGKRPAAGISIASDCVLQRVNPADADVFMRLRTGNQKMLQ